MTDRELMQQALDALFNLRWAASERDKKNRIRQFDEFMDGSDEAIEALRARLAQPEQEHSEQWWKHEVSNAWAQGYEKGRLQREWQGLTDEEIDETAWPYFIGNIMPSVKIIVRQLEAKLKEKNGTS